MIGFKWFIFDILKIISEWIHSSRKYLIVGSKFWIKTKRNETKKVGLAKTELKMFNNYINNFYNCHLSFIKLVRVRKTVAIKFLKGENKF